MTFWFWLSSFSNWALEYKFTLLKRYKSLPPLPSSHGGYPVPSRPVVLKSRDNTGSRVQKNLAKSLNETSHLFLAFPIWNIYFFSRFEIVNLVKWMVICSQGMKWVFFWCRYVIECPNCGEIYRSRQFWYGNSPPEMTAVRTEIRHVWPGVSLTLWNQRL